MRALFHTEDGGPRGWNPLGVVWISGGSNDCSIVKNALYAWIENGHSDFEEENTVIYAFHEPMAFFFHRGPDAILIFGESTALHSRRRAGHKDGPL